MNPNHDDINAAASIVASIPTSFTRYVRIILQLDKILHEYDEYYIHHIVSCA